MPLRGTDPKVVTLLAAEDAVIAALRVLETKRIAMTTAQAETRAAEDDLEKALATAAAALKGLRA